MRSPSEAKGDVVENRSEGCSNRKQLYMLRVYKSWCKKCGICVAFCPKGALERDEDGFPRWRDMNTCIGCGMCQLRCPDFAIEVLPVEGDTDEGQ